MSSPQPHLRNLLSIATLGAVAGLAYSQQLTAPPPSNPLDYTTNWIGNSFSGNNFQHVPLDIQGIYVGYDGSVYTNTGWDEGGLANSIFKNGQLTSPNVSNGAGGPAIAVVNGMIFASQTTGVANNPPCAAGGCGVNVYNASTLQSAGTLSGDSRVNSIGGSPNIYGIAAYNNQAYIAIADANVIDIFNTSNLSLARSLSINNPGRLAIDSNGGLWVGHKNLSALPSLDGNVYDIFGDFGLSTIDHYDNNGNYINTITLPGAGEVSALWIDSNNNLYVGDQSQYQNIKIYSNILSNPTLSSTFGVKGGIYASHPGVVGPGLFRFITGIGTDSSGNIYVSDDDFGHGVLLSSYQPSGQLNWQVNALEFVSLGSIDPHSEGDLYDAYHHFKINYASPPGDLGTYYSDTYNPFAYPDDLRTTSDVSTGQIQYIQDRKFLLVANQGGVAFQIARFQSGSEIAIPCVAFDYGSFLGQYQDFAVQPDNGEFIWRDLNGNGVMESNEFTQPSSPTHRDGGDFWMDSNGDVWQVNYLSSAENSIHIRRYLFQGFDAYGAPIYDFNHIVIYNQSTDFPELADAARVVFQPGETPGGTLYIAGSSTGTGSFTQVARIDNWNSGNRTASWVANIPWDSNSNSSVIPNSFAETGRYFFVDFNTPHYVLVYSTADGSYVGEIDPGSNVGGSNNVGNDDEWTSISAFQRSNGQYVVTKEEDYQAKLLMYLWTPSGVTLQTATPAFSPAQGTYGSTQTVNISDSTSGSTIYYTTNGTMPTTSSPVYSGPISVSSSETIDAIATAPGNANSSLATAVYTINSGGGEAPYHGPHNVPGTVEASDYDTGGPGVAYYQTVNGAQTGYRSDNSGAVEGNPGDNNSPANGYDLGWTAARQWTKYTVVVGTAGTYTVTFSLASPNGQTGAFHLQNSSGVNLSGSVNVPRTGGWYTWQTVTANVTLPAGTQTLKLAQDNSGWNIEYLSFASSGTHGPVVEINSGGPAVSGTRWAADTDVSGGAGETWSNTINTSNITNPAPVAVYQSDHFAYNVSSFTYTIPALTAGASYTVRLHFCENFWTATGQRVFNVSINGSPVLTNFDVFKTAGGQSIANIQQFTATANSSGQIAIVFTTLIDNAMVSGIEIDD